MEITNKTIAILGYGISMAASIQKLSIAQGTKLVLFSASSVTATLPENVTVINDVTLFANYHIDFCIKSPGIPYTQPEVCYFVEHDIPVYTDVEVFMDDVPGKVIAITGSNGKTTVTTMIYEILSRAIDDVRLGGNIGIPIADLVDGATDDTVFVLELSSFQLKGTKSFHPDVALIINIVPSHLDYHLNVDDYVDSKFKITENMTENDLLIVNGLSTQIVEKVKDVSTQVTFIGNPKLSEVFISSDGFVYRKEVIMMPHQLGVPGTHNQMNALFAIAVAKHFDIENHYIVEALQGFGGVKHRLQFLNKVNGVDIYNDSKSTNELAAMIALRSFQKPIIWIAGGYDRGMHYDEIHLALEMVKVIVGIGQTAPIFEKVANEKSIPFISAVTVEEAFLKAMAHAENDEVVLFSPACASYDMFNNFEERGEAFIQVVERYERNEI